MIAAFIFAIVAALMGIIRPDINVVIKSQPMARSAPTDTGVLFVAGLADQGPLAPTLVNSLAEFVQWFGNRVSYSILYDAMDLYFREGGRLAYIARVVGPAATTGFKNLLDAGAGISLVVTAIGPGAYSSTYKVGVVAGVGAGTFQLQVSDASNVILEQSPDLIDQNAAIAWARNSAYIRVALGATALNPAPVALGALSAGADDRASITDTHRINALNTFVRDLGPGQVAYPGGTTDPLHVGLLQHATDNARVALLDLPDSVTVATLTGSAIAARTNGRWGAAFAPWLSIPGVVPNTTRIVPPSTFIAGKLAINDVQLSVGTPAAGEHGQTDYATGLSQVAWSDPNRQTLNAQGVNVIVPKYGGYRAYGWRSLADPNSDPWWTNFSHARIAMQLATEGGAIMEGHMFDEMDGQGRLFKRVEGQLIAMCNEMYQLGDLYGATATDAFAVVCDQSNNTPTTIANKELHASVAFRASEFAEMIQLDLVKVPVNSTIA